MGNASSQEVESPDRTFDPTLPDTTNTMDAFDQPMEPASSKRARKGTKRALEEESERDDDLKGDRDFPGAMEDAQQLPKKKKTKPSKVDEENVRRGYEASLELDDEEGVMEFLNGERGGRICEMVLGGA